jgi:hypothetical protein
MQGKNDVMALLLACSCDERRPQHSFRQDSTIEVELGFDGVSIIWIVDKGTLLYTYNGLVMLL